MTDKEVAKAHEDFYTHWRGLGKAMQALSKSKNMQEDDAATRILKRTFERAHQTLKCLDVDMSSKVWVSENDVR